MQVVIDIDDNLYTRIFDNGKTRPLDLSMACVAIRKGTPLPKGHGRLGDLDEIWCKLKELEESYEAEFLKDSNVIHESAMNGRLYGFTNSRIMVQDAPTIIEADKAESGEE